MKKRTAHIVVYQNKHIWIDCVKKRNPDPRLIEAMKPHESGEIAESRMVEFKEDGTYYVINENR